MNEILTLTKELGGNLLHNGEPQPTTLFVCLMGIATVFAGLICLIILCKIVGAFSSKEKKTATPVATPVATPTVNQPIENRQEIIAAVSAAVAEELGTDVSAIRILSFKKI